MSELIAVDSTAADATAAESLVLKRINVAPAQTWNRLRANDITLTVPTHPRGNGVRTDLPRLFDRVPSGMGEAVTSWVRTQTDAARFIDVPPHTTPDEPLVIALAANELAETGVLIREGASATIVVAVGEKNGEAASSTDDDITPTSANVLHVVVEAGAHLKLIEVVGTTEDHQYLGSTGLVLGRDATAEVSQFALGGATVALGLTADLMGERSRIELTCRYHGRHQQAIDVNHTIRQLGRDTRAEVSESGVLEDAAHKSLRAAIELVRGARGAQGSESETVLVLGDDVINKTMPVILCDEDDVSGDHGATIGSVSAEQMNYLAMRGLSREAAEQLFVRALFEDAIINAPAGAAHEVAVTQAERVLGTEVAHDFDEAQGVLAHE